MSQNIKTEVIEGIPHIHPEEVKKMDSSWDLIDVRSEEEFNGELGHIKNSQHIEMGPPCENYLHSGDKNKKILFICRSGNRSGQVTELAQSLGFKNSYNMTGGMLLWNELNLEES